MEWLMMDLSEIQPSQLYINESKLRAIQEYIHEVGVNNMEPLPIKKIGSNVFFTDGHTRAYALYKEGVKEIKVYWDNDNLDWIAYLICVSWCQESQITSVSHLESRVISDQEYGELWLERCQIMQEYLVKKPVDAILVKPVKKLLDKERICEQILRALPEWFGIESAILDYRAQLASQHMWVARIGAHPIGFIALKDHNEFTSEISVMGLYQEFHRLGIGRRLLLVAEGFLKEQQKTYLTVKTLGSSHPCSYYQKTRDFYRRNRFLPLEELKTLWGEENPCLFLVKSL